MVTKTEKKLKKMDFSFEQFKKTEPPKTDSI